MPRKRGWAKRREGGLLYPRIRGLGEMRRRGAGVGVAEEEAVGVV